MTTQRVDGVPVFTYCSSTPQYVATPFFTCSSNVGTSSFLSIAVYAVGLSALAFEQTTRKYVGVPLPLWYIVVCINKSSCLVAAICPGRGPPFRISSSTFTSPEIEVDDHAAPFVYPSGVCMTCSKVDQPRMVPSAVIFSATGTNVFSVSSAYCAQFARGTWNWLTYVYTTGVGSIWGRAAGTSITANTIKSRPAIRFVIIYSSWIHWQAAWRNSLEGRSSSLNSRSSRRVRGYGVRPLYG